MRVPERREIAEGRRDIVLIGLTELDAGVLWAWLLRLIAAEGARSGEGKKENHEPMRKGGHKGGEAHARSSQSSSKS